MRVSKKAKRAKKSDIRKGESKNSKFLGKLRIESEIRTDLVRKNRRISVMQCSAKAIWQ